MAKRLRKSSSNGTQGPATKITATILDELLEVLGYISSEIPQHISELKVPYYENPTYQVQLVKILSKIFKLTDDKLNSLIEKYGKTIRSTTIDSIKFDFIFTGTLGDYQIAFCRSNIHGTKQPIILYKSGSQGVWRLALSGTMGLRFIFDKLSDYTSATLIDFRLQKFIEETYAEIYHLPLSENISYGFLFNYTMYVGNNIDNYTNFLTDHQQAVVFLMNYLKNKKIHILSDEITNIKDGLSQNGYISEAQITKLDSAVNSITNKSLQAEINKNVIEQLRNIANHVKTIRNFVISQLDTSRLYNGIGSEIFALLAKMSTYHFKNPCSKKLLEFLMEMCDIYQTRGKSFVTDEILKLIKNFIVSKIPNHETPNPNDKECLLDLLAIITRIFGDIFTYTEPTIETDKFITKFENKEFSVKRDSNFTGSACRVVTQRQTSRRRTSTNNIDRPQYTHKTPTVKLLDDELIVKTVVVKIKHDVIKGTLPKDLKEKIENAKFLLYYGEYKLCGINYNIPFCLTPCNEDGTQISINKFGLPSKYISLGIYIGKTYDYANQVCPLYDEKVKHVKITSKYEYTFCGNFYNDIWPFELMKKLPAPMQVSPAGVASASAMEVTGGKLIGKHKRNKHTRKRRGRQARTELITQGQQNKTIKIK